MPPPSINEPVDYLMIGHLTIDRTGDGFRIGGTAAYSALTARMLGLKVGIFTSWGEESDPAVLQGIPIINQQSERSTEFENISGPDGRKQRLFYAAPELDSSLIPNEWRAASIVHLGPVVHEVNPVLLADFPSAMIGLTPQGWFRKWDSNGWVSVTSWQNSQSKLRNAGAVVVSVEDLSGGESQLEQLANSCKVLAATEGEKGVRLYWNGDVRRFRPPQVEAVDTTGAGDIFAAALFIRLYTTRDPWEAARFATLLAGFSVTRRGLESVPTQDEIKTCMVEVL